mmetsp:Transcript_84572/g.244369  ORF Transcript_84572/g.244369 Transcript_84572/m.244369 type:complete len:376 (-) Transcript_84572:733-1860(-)
MQIADRGAHIQQRPEEQHDARPATGRRPMRPDMGVEALALDVFEDHRELPAAGVDQSAVQRDDAGVPHHSEQAQLVALRGEGARALVGGRLVDGHLDSDRRPVEPRHGDAAEAALAQHAGRRDELHVRRLDKPMLPQPDLRDPREGDAYVGLVVGPPRDPVDVAEQALRAVGWSAARHIAALNTAQDGLRGLVADRHLQLRGLHDRFPRRRRLQLAGRVAGRPTGLHKADHVLGDARTAHGGYIQVNADTVPHAVAQPQRQRPRHSLRPLRHCLLLVLGGADRPLEAFKLLVGHEVPDARPALHRGWRQEQEGRQLRARLHQAQVAVKSEHAVAEAGQQVDGDVEAPAKLAFLGLEVLDVPPDVSPVLLLPPGPE